MADDALFPPSLPVLTGMRRSASGREWLDQLPEVVEELRQRWELRLGAPYHGGSCSWATPALRSDGTRAVLKVTWPHREARAEGDALRLWAGRGSVMVHEHDRRRYALLLERCEPGTELGAARHIPAEERLLLGAGVLRKLWDAGGRGSVRSSQVDPLPEAHGLPEVDRLPEVAGWWADLVEERAAKHDWPAEMDTGLFAPAAALLRELPLRAGRETIVHGDFNPGNVLSAEREPWLAIDAKPLYGDPAFDPWPLIQQIDDPFAHPAPRRVLTRRTALVADALGEDVARIRAWAVARHVEYLLWSVEGGDEGGPDADLSESVRLMGQARILAQVAGL